MLVSVISDNDYIDKIEMIQISLHTKMVEKIPN